MRPSGKRYLHHCPCRSEKNQRTEDKLITLMKKVRFQLSPFFAHTSTERTLIRTWFVPMTKIKSRNGKPKESGFSLKDKEQILAEIQKHEFQADSDKRSIQELNGTIESQRRKIDPTIAGDEQLRRDQQLLHVQKLEQNRDLREAHMKSLNEMEELKRVRGSRVDEFREED